MGQIFGQLHLLHREAFAWLRAKQCDILHQQLIGGAQVFRFAEGRLLATHTA